MKSAGKRVTNLRPFRRERKYCAYKSSIYESNIAFNERLEIYHRPLFTIRNACAFVHSGVIFRHSFYYICSTLYFDFKEKIRIVSKQYTFDKTNFPNRKNIDPVLGLYEDCIWTVVTFDFLVPI